MVSVEKVKLIVIVIAAIVVAVGLVLIQFVSQAANATRLQIGFILNLGIALFVIGAFLLVVLVPSY